MTADFTLFHGNAQDDADSQDAQMQECPGLTLFQSFLKLRPRGVNDLT
jgi:hypothetical protein